MLFVHCAGRLPADVFCCDLRPDSRRSSTALLARQLRLKLLADEDSDIPKYCSAMVVSIQAIATFQALNDCQSDPSLVLGLNPWSTS